jgi:uncharacterized protein YndB with AHSA1/START domain
MQTATTFDIRHRLGVHAPPSVVFEHLATVDGLERWWTDDVRGGTAVGETIGFYFGAPDRFFDMQVIESVPDERVRWRCTDGPPEWIGTDVTFDLGDGDETVVLFGHNGWREPVEFMSHCSTKWAAYLLSLKASAESGSGRPYPHDQEVSSWD